MVGLMTIGDYIVVGILDILEDGDVRGRHYYFETDLSYVMWRPI
jgi:hypothetical protein